MKIFNYETHIRDWIGWYFGPRATPHSPILWPIDGWITDPEEVARAIMLDDHLGLATPATPNTKERP